MGPLTWGASENDRETTPMGKTLRRPIQRHIGSRKPAPSKPTPSAATLPALRSFSAEDGDELRRILDGAYDVPGLSFPTPPGILDVGAHAGAATTFFLRRWPGCSVHAYEPHPDLGRAFQENTRGSGWSVTLHAVAVVGANWPDRHALLLDSQRGPWHRSLYQLGSQLTTGTKVDVVRAGTLPEADVLKVSTNGCELDILDAYTFMTRLRAVLLRRSRKVDHAPLVERLRGYGLNLVRDAGGDAAVGDMIFARA